MREGGILDVTVSSMYFVPASKIYTWDQVPVSVCEMCVYTCQVL